MGPKPRSCTTAANSLNSLINESSVQQLHYIHIFRGQTAWLHKIFEAREMWDEEIQGIVIGPEHTAGVQLSSQQLSVIGHHASFNSVNIF